MLIISSEVRSLVREKLKIGPRGGEKVNGPLAESQRQREKCRILGAFCRKSNYVYSLRGECNEQKKNSKDVVDQLMCS